MSSFYRHVQIGRVYLSVYKSRGLGFRIRRHRNYVSAWIGRFVFDAAWLHKKGCLCFDCNYEYYSIMS
jgi:hypothetical protein